MKKLNQNLSDISSWLQFDRIPWLIAGPCSAESKQQVISIARKLSKSPHVKAFRAGIWKPRTRPDTFEGVGRVGLEWLKEVKAETSLMTTTEVANTKHVELCLENDVDILWIGARTTVNPFLVQEIANALKGADVPVLVKNPINAELGLWLGAIERLYNAGIRKLGAIHRGFSTYVKMAYRNSPNWRIPIELKRLLPSIPLICDPSHIGGHRSFIEPISQTALDLGITGLMIETHNDPDNALSDSKQQITPNALMKLLNRLRARDAAITDKEVKRKIARLRAEISQTDSQIIEDLAERMRRAEEIGRLKQEHNIPVLQLDRWEHLLKDHMDKAQQLGLEGEFIKAVFELIHTHAIKRQLK
ncbi:MAG: bifunctional 3-deoxy-7-phosphoheptulonate synthase/chorismate mutase type II [Sedimentisphaerales bacterium]|nr:bifunctional 3-deoxy-7-phosphoheptulonate synthase/chorismate mutase type II [Sedimentisphaerales bacterium]